MNMNTVMLEELMVRGQPSLDPRNTPTEEFELYSIPAYDNREPEQVLGSDVGSSKKIVEPGDLLLSRIVPHIRRAWVVPPCNGKRQIASGEWIVFRHNSFEPRYLRHFVMGDHFHAQFMNTVAGVGGSLVRARPENVGRIEVSLPPLSEQKRIADILDKADAIRRKRHEATDHVTDLLRSSYLGFFGHPRRNSNGWEVEPLRNVCSVDRGKFTPRPRNDPKYYGGPFPFIQTGDISSSGGMLSKWKQTLNDHGVAVSRSFGPGTVVIAIVGATIGETAILTEEMYCPDSVIGISPRKGRATSEYIEFTLRFFKQHFRDMAPETARANINLETLRPLEIPVPPLQEQQRFSSVFRKCYAMKQKLAEPRDETNDLFNSLVQRAFRGEL